MLDAALHITKAYEKKCAQPAGKKRKRGLDDFKQ